MNPVNALLSGAIGMAALVIALFFLRFWFGTRDRFFLYFSLSFFLQAVARLLLESGSLASEDAPVHYLLRLAAYGLIVFALIDKNRCRPATTGPDDATTSSSARRT